MNTFEEKQKFSNWILWPLTLLLVPIGSFICYGIYQQMILGEPFGDKPGSDLSLILVTILLLGLPLFFWTLYLKTEMDHQRIQLHFFPFLRREIQWSEVSNFEIVQYGFVGGWGVRISSKYGTVYNAQGNIGLALQLNNGKKVLIGTQKRAELERFLKNIA